MDMWGNVNFGTGDVAQLAQNPDCASTPASHKTDLGVCVYYPNTGERQESQKVKDILSYIASSRSA